MYTAETSRVYIDSEALKNQINEKGISYKMIQKKAGRGDGYVSRIIKRGWTNTPFCEWLQDQLDIPMETFVKALMKPESENEVKPKTEIRISYKKLYEVMYEATYKATYKAVCDAIKDCTSKESKEEE